MGIRKYDMKCPKCSGELSCPCDACSIRNDGKPLYIWKGDEIIECCHCHFSADSNWWADFDVEKEELIPSE